MEDQANPGVYYIMHKPQFVLSSTVDESTLGRSTLTDIAISRKFPIVGHVGRLDYETSGLLVMTNDVELSIALTTKSFAETLGCIQPVKKVYLLTVAGQLTDEDARVARLSEPLFYPGIGEAGIWTRPPESVRVVRSWKSDCQPAQKPVVSDIADQTTNYTCDGVIDSSAISKPGFLSPESETTSVSGSVTADIACESGVITSAVGGTTTKLSRREQKRMAKKARKKARDGGSSGGDECLPPPPQYLAHGGWLTQIEVVLTEGRNRQIRRLCYRSKLALRLLHRVEFAGVTLDGVQEAGECRYLSGSEVEALYALAMPDRTVAQHGPLMPVKWGSSNIHSSGRNSDNHSNNTSESNNSSSSSSDTAPITSDITTSSSSADAAPAAGPAETRMASLEEGGGHVDGCSR